MKEYSKHTTGELTERLRQTDLEVSSLRATQGDPSELHSLEEERDRLISELGRRING